MNSKKNVFGIIASVLLIGIFIIIIINSKNAKKNSHSGNNYSTIVEHRSNIEKVRNREEEIHNQIKSAFIQVENDYRNAVTKYNGFKRSDFYNEQRLNEKMSEGRLKLVDLEEISLKSLYDLDENKLESLPELGVSLGNKDSFQTGNFILKCQYGLESYTYYYLISISNNGLRNYQWIFYTENEVFDNDFMVELELEENLE